MRIRKHSGNETRWHLSAWTSGHQEDMLFYAWMQEHCAECMCVKRANYGSGDPYWELRGGDIGYMMLIMMTWG